MADRVRSQSFCSACCRAAAWPTRPVNSPTRFTRSSRPSKLWLAASTATGTPAAASCRKTACGPASSVAINCVGVSARTPSADKVRAYPTLGNFLARAGYADVVSTPTSSASACNANTISVNAPPTLTMRRGVAVPAATAARTGITPVASSALDANTPNCNRAVRRESCTPPATPWSPTRRMAALPVGWHRSAPAIHTALACRVCARQKTLQWSRPVHQTTPAM